MTIARRRTRSIIAGIVLALGLGLFLDKCDNARPGSPFTQVNRVTTVQNCTPAYGQCQVTVFRYHHRNGTVTVWTCYAQPPIKPGASNINLALEDCYLP